MAEAITEGRDDVSPHAPRIFSIKIDVDLIRNVIGPGGKTIRSIVDQTGAKINVEDDGTVQVATNDLAAAEKAIKIIEAMVKQPEIGENYEGVVKRIEPYGAFLEMLPNQDGLLHISELAMERIPDIRDVLTEGDTLMVRIIDIDGNDRIKLSRRVILEEEARERGEEIPARRDDDRPPRRDDRGSRPTRRRSSAADPAVTTAEVVPRAAVATTARVPSFFSISTTGVSWSFLCPRGRLPHLGKKKT